ncbi:hypothetical protein K466DRAFT_600157 [Polyporus arcularius HHB13444]|uniref:F-box domain-containing protein n=1 Tax=Polyporus arcularius HHB13444 TaxID=1314778 RepID=A0A5C3PAC5_9APHY|nr:hypothetical protein K466DRAFT_600157 [Polyporus arcularius HHB13444]
MALFATLDDLRSSTSFLLPEGDLAVFVGLKPDDVRATSLAKIEAHTARIKTVQRHILELHSIHNAALPLHVELPPELVLEIFRHLPFAYRGHIRVMHVCRLWRSLVQRTPEFWADFLSHSLEQSTRRRYKGLIRNGSEQMFLTSLRRSSPLGVNLTGGEWYLETIRTVPHHVCRLSYLTVTIGASSVDTLFSILRIKIPLLEKLLLRLTCKASNGLMRTEILDKIGSWVPRADHFPRLHTLDVNGVLFPSLAVPTLKHLKLVGCAPAQCASLISQPCSRTNVRSLEALVSGLQRCPALLTCELNACLPSRIITSHGVGVHLPQLQEFAVCTDSPSTRVILETITFPPHVYLSTSRCITAQDSPLPTPPLPTLLSLHTLSLHVRSLWSPSQEQQEIQCNGTYKGSTDGQRRLLMGPDRIQWVKIGRSEVLNTLVLTFSPLERLTALELEFGFRIPVGEADWKLVLKSFVRLTSLTVQSDSCRNLLRVLRRGQFRCPLDTLSISCLKGRRVQELLVRTIEDASKHLRLRRLEFRQTVLQRERWRTCTRCEREDVDNVPLSTPQLAQLKAVIAEVITFPEVRDAE